MFDVYNPEFAYFIGNFMADGSFYITKRKNSQEYRFEFVDGSPYESELKYSFMHIKLIQHFLKDLLRKQIGNIRQRGNRFVLSFRNKELADFFINHLKLSPGDKSRIIDIPHIYRNSKYEKDFWVGYLDGDGSIARKSNKVSIESMSPKIIDSFSYYLTRKGIFFSKYSSRRGSDFSYVIVIRSVSFKDFANKIGFRHPLKSRLLKKKITKPSFFVNNSLKQSFPINTVIDYTKIFDSSVFVVCGSKLVEKNVPKMKNKNVKFIALFFNKTNKLSLLKKINQYRFKKSKGSINSVRLPLLWSEELLKIAKFVRIRNSGISFSKRYTESFNEDYNLILQSVERLFDIKPKYTCKNEPLFCSGVLADFFKYILN